MRSVDTARAIAAPWTGVLNHVHVMNREHPNRVPSIPKPEIAHRSNGMAHLRDSEAVSWLPYPPTDRSTLRNGASERPRDSVLSAQLLRLVISVVFVSGVVVHDLRRDSCSPADSDSDSGAKTAVPRSYLRNLSRAVAIFCGCCRFVSCLLVCIRERRTKKSNNNS